MSDLDRILTLARHGIDNDAQSQVPAERELKEVPVTKEAVGEFSQPLYDLQDELELEDNILVDEMARWMSGDDIRDFVSHFRQNHDMPEGGREYEGVEEGKKKDHDKDGDVDSDDYLAAKDKAIKKAKAEEK